MARKPCTSKNSRYEHAINLTIMIFKIICRRLAVVFALMVMLPLVVVAQADTTRSSVTHVIQRGETLQSIAKAYGVSYDSLVSLNPEAKEFTYVGMEIKIPDTVAAPAVPEGTTFFEMNEPVQVNQPLPSESAPVEQNYNQGGSSSPVYFDYEPRVARSYDDTSSISLYFALQAGIGFSTFTWSNGGVHGTMSYSGDIAMQLYLRDKTGFLPANWYSELALGYDKRGAADFDMSYVHARVYPIGYAIPVSGFNVVLKAGATVGYPLGELKSSMASWSADLQIGVGGGLQIDFGRFAIGCNVEYDFTKVSSDAPETLNNFAVLGTLSYKFVKIGN